MSNNYGNKNNFDPYSAGYVHNVSVNTSHRSSYKDQLERLVDLTLNHPFVKESVDKIRKKCKIPLSNGFAGFDEIKKWKVNNRKEYLTFTSMKEDVLSELSFPASMSVSMNNFLHYFFLSEDYAWEYLEHKVNVVVGRVIDAPIYKYQREKIFQPRARYIEVLPHTNMEHVKTLYTKIREVFPEKQDDIVPKPGDIAKDCFNYSQEGHAQKDIAELIKNTYGKKNFTQSNVSKAIQAYTKALEEIRSLD